MVQPGGLCGCPVFRGPTAFQAVQRESGLGNQERHAQFSTWRLPRGKSHKFSQEPIGPCEPGTTPENCQEKQLSVHSRDSQNPVVTIFIITEDWTTSLGWVWERSHLRWRETLPQGRRGVYVCVRARMHTAWYRDEAATVQREKAAEVSRGKADTEGRTMETCPSEVGGRPDSTSPGWALVPEKQTRSPLYLEGLLVTSVHRSLSMHSLITQHSLVTYPKTV